VKSEAGFAQFLTHSRNKSKAQARREIALAAYLRIPLTITHKCILLGRSLQDGGRVGSGLGNLLAGTVGRCSSQLRKAGSRHRRIR